MASLILYNNSASNPLTLDLSNELDVQRGDGLDPASPSFSERVFTHSLLKEGATFALENAQLKEAIFPLLVGAGQSLTSSGVAARIQQINQILQTPGATASWQDDGMSQATYFTLASGQLDPEYDFRSQGSAHFVRCKLRLFAQPFVTPAAPRFYARASAVGPLLMISPYASGGAYSVAASTQAGVAGFGGKPAGASTGIFYGGNPTLAGDAPALLRVSYTAPVGPTATLSGVMPYTVMSWLPDQNYRPLITASEITTSVTNSNFSYKTAGSAVASSYVSLGAHVMTLGLYFYPYANGQSAVPATYAGNHRLFAIARASVAVASATPYLNLLAGPAAQNILQTASVTSNDWALYDIGTFTLRASENSPPVGVGLTFLNQTFGQTADVTALVMLPEKSSWMMSPQQVNPFVYGFAPQFAIQNSFPSGYYSNTLLIDDTLPDQFAYAGTTKGFTPSPAVMGGSVGRITQYSRGVIPRPDPAYGVPILAFLGVGQQSIPTTAASVALTAGGVQVFAVASAAWPNPQALPAYAQVDVVERARYVLD